MHHGNKQAYDAAYQRGLAGKSSRPIWGFLLAPFEDEYTRQSREKGQRDGAAARAQAEQSGTPAAN
jgi:ribosome modulation factor